MKPYESYKEVDLPWLDTVPAHWEIVKINELFDERVTKVSDKDFAPLSVSKQGILPQLSTAVKTDNGDNRKLVRKGDFVINSRSDRKGASGISPFDGSVSLINIVLKPRKGIFNEFFHYLLRCNSFKEEYYRNGRGIVSDLWTTRYSEMKTIPLPIPPLSEQNQIVKYLNYNLYKIDKFLTAKKKQVALLKEYKQAVINQAVTKGLDPKTKMKESGAEWLGEIPEDWEVVKLKYCVKSNENSLSKFCDPDFTFPYLEISSVAFGYLKKQAELVSFESSPSRARRIVKEGDTIISTVRTYLKAICYIDESLSDHIVSTGFSVLSPNDKILPGILFYVLSSDLFLNNVVKNSIGISYPAISDKKLLDLKIVLPISLDKQNEIVAFLEDATAKIDANIDSIEQEIRLMEEFHTRLISDVVTGKIDVRNVVIPDFSPENPDLPEETIDDFEEEREQSVD